MTQFEKHQAHYGSAKVARSNIDPTTMRVYIKKSDTGTTTLFDFYLKFMKHFDTDYHNYLLRVRNWEDWHKKKKGGDEPSILPIVKGTPTFETWRTRWFTVTNVKFGLKTKDNCSTCISLTNRILALLKAGKKAEAAEVRKVREEHLADQRWRRDRILELKESARRDWKSDLPSTTEELRRVIREAAQTAENNEVVPEVPEAADGTD